MKIVYFLRDISDCGGIQQTTCNIINGLLEQKDYEITTISIYHHSHETFFPLNKKVEKIALFEKPVDQRFSFFRIKNRMKKALSSLSYDLLIVQGSLFSNFIPSFAWKKNNVIVCEHGHYDMGTNIGLHAMGRNKAVKNARAIVSLTELDRDVYQSHCKNDVIVKAIPNQYIELDFEPIYNVDSKTIVSCGRLDNIKQFDQVVNTAKNVITKYPNWKWCIYGDGPNKELLQKQIDDHGLHEKVILCGHENNKKIIYGDKAFLVLTSKFEGFGMVLIEALQFKLPLISYDVKFGPKEIVVENYNGHLVPPNDTQKLADAVCELIENKEERIKLSNNSIKSLERFSRSNVTKKWIELFEKIAVKE